MKFYKNIDTCRLCGYSKLIHIMSLGHMTLTGIFSKNKSKSIANGPVDLVQCDLCKLVQLLQTYNLKDMYGLNYGYRSGLNSGMVNHLKSNIDYIRQFVSLKNQDIVLDIGSNDGTTLNYLSKNNLLLIGMDPSGEKFRQYYNSDVTLITDFFSKEKFTNLFNNKKASLVTSFSMFYDLEDPLQFAQDVHSILDIDGIWFMEQSYLPSMIKTNSFDTICQEHLEYYSFNQIEYLAEKIGFNILDVNTNDVNGGSFQVVLGKNKKLNSENQKKIKKFKDDEKIFFQSQPFQKFKNNVLKAKIDLINMLTKLKADNKRVFALGASTKGNVLLQFFEIDKLLIPYIGEVNSTKFGTFTPGTNIPIISEDDLLKKNPDYLLILPWHFRNFFINNEKFKGIKLIFPLPKLEIIHVN